MPVYLDHAATTPMLPAAREAMIEELGQAGNASAVHAFGRRARRVVEESREEIAAALGAHPSEVIFTSGGTESDNLAIKGTFAARFEDGARPRVVAGATDHHAVIDSVEHLAAHAGAQAVFVEPTPAGVITPEAFAAALDDDGPGRGGGEATGFAQRGVAVASVVWANNEIGTISPIAQLAALARERGVPMHSDAVQAVGHIPVDFAASGLDLLTFTGHKLGGPLGAGVLLARRDARLVSLAHGGGQERQLRSGTLDVPSVRALAVAVTHSVAVVESEMTRLVALRDILIDGLVAQAGVRVTGAWARGSAHDRLPGNVHVLVDGADGDALILGLDAAGIACATGSACAAGVTRASHVVTALGVPQDQARGALRLTLGHTTTAADIDTVLAVIPETIERARGARGAA